MKNVKKYFNISDIGDIMKIGYQIVNIHVVFDINI